MLATILVVGSLVLAVVWIVSELKFRTPARILVGSLMIASAASSIWAVKDLEYRVFSLWVSQALEEVSAQVKAGNETAVQQAIARYLEKVRHDPSNRAAAELIHELNPQKFGGESKP